MRPQKIFLFRHGQIITKYHGKYVGHLDVPLSEIGKKQAQKINDFIKKTKNPRVITSDLKRTFSELNCAPLKEKAFREINFGKWDGLSWDEIEQLFPKEKNLFLNEPDNFTFPSGESYAQLAGRVMPAFDDLLNSEHENMIFVIHAGVIRTILSKKLNIPFADLFNFKIDYGQCTTLEKVGNDFSLIT